MHVHASQSDAMRTTVEITDVQRARLLEIAAMRGEKGFSKLVQEAIDLYREKVAGIDRQRRVRAAIGALGSLSGKAGDDLEKAVRKLRSSWR